MTSNNNRDTDETPTNEKPTKFKGRDNMKDIKDFEECFTMVELTSDSLQLKLMKGELSWNDQQIQLFLPLALNFCNFDWLRLIAEHNCIDEDEQIIKNFLDMCESLREVNETTLKNAALSNLRKRFK